MPLKLSKKYLFKKSPSQSGAKPTKIALFLMFQPIFWRFLGSEWESFAKIFQAGGFSTVSLAGCLQNLSYKADTMFKISNKIKFVILIFMLVASGCTAAPTNVTVGELSPATVETIQESIILSNCGGTAEISQYAERSSQISVEGAGQSAFLMNVIKNSIEL